MQQCERERVTKMRENLKKGKVKATLCYRNNHARIKTSQVYKNVLQEVKRHLFHKLYTLGASKLEGTVLTMNDPRAEKQLDGGNGLAV